MPTRKLSSPPTAYAYNPTLDTYAGPTASTEDLFVDDRSVHSCSSSEDSPTDDDSAHSYSSEDLQADDYPANITRAGSTYGSSTEKLLAEDYAELSLAPTTNAATSPSKGGNLKANKSKLSWENAKKHTFEKPTVRDAAAAGYAGFIQGKKTLALANSTQKRKPGSAEEKRAEVVVKVGKAVFAAVVEGKKTWDDTQARRKLGLEC